MYWAAAGAMGPMRALKTRGSHSKYTNDEMDERKVQRPQPHTNKDKLKTFITIVAQILFSPTVCVRELIIYLNSLCCVSCFYLKLELKRGCLKEAHLFYHQLQRSPSRKHLCQHVN